MFFGISKSARFKGKEGIYVLIRERTKKSRFFWYLLMRDFIVAETECLIPVEVCSTLVTEMSTSLLYNFEKDAVSSVMKFACEPVSKNTRQGFDFPCGLNKSTIAVASKPSEETLVTA